MGLEKIVPWWEERIDAVGQAAVIAGILYGMQVLLDLAGQVLKVLHVSNSGISVLFGPSIWFAVFYVGTTLAYGAAHEYARWNSRLTERREKGSQLVLGNHAMFFWLCLFLVVAAVQPLFPWLKIPAGLQFTAYAMLFGLPAIYISGDTYRSDLKRKAPDVPEDLKQSYWLAVKYEKRVLKHVHNCGFITEDVAAERFGLERFDAMEMLVMLEWEGILRKTLNEDGMVIYEEIVYRLTDKARREMEKKKRDEQEGDNNA
jgi:ribosomal protein S25